jgi:hypothetical protein
MEIVQAATTLSKRPKGDSKGEKGWKSLLSTGQRQELRDAERDYKRVLETMRRVGPGDRATTTAFCVASALRSEKRAGNESPSRFATGFPDG